MISLLGGKIKENRRVILFLALLVFAFFVFGGEEALAATTGTGGTLIDPKTAKNIENWVRFLGGLLSVFVGLFTHLIAFFLSPTWMNGSTFGISQYLRDIWVLVSNVVYIAFAGIIIFIAFMNIIGKGEGNYELKKALPKLIIGILIVPFSWFFIQFVLAISGYLTIAALTLPSDTFKAYETQLSGVKIPRECTINLSSSSSGSTNSSTTKKDSLWDCTGSPTTTVGALFSSGNATDSIFGLTATYVYGVLGIDGIDKLNSFDAKTIRTVADLIVKIVFDIAFLVVYCILFISIGLVLFTRGIWLWLYAMFSPVFGLGYFFGKDSAGGEGIMSKFSLKEFIALAMVPVYTMAALSFGLLFLYIVGNGMTATPVGSLGVNGISIGTGGTNGEDSILTTGGENGLKLTIKGAAANPKDSIGVLSSFTKNSLGVIGTLIMKIFGIVVLWSAVMAALSASKITGEIIKPIKEFGSTVGRVVTKSPQYLPIFGGQSMSSLNKFGSQLNTNFEKTAQSKASNLAGKFGIGDTYESQTKTQTLDARNATTQSQTLNELNRNVRNMNGDVTKLDTKEFKDFLKTLIEARNDLSTNDKANLNKNIDDGKINEVLKELYAKSGGIYTYTDPKQWVRDSGSSTTGNQQNAKTPQNINIGTINTTNVGNLNKANNDADRIKEINNLANTIQNDSNNKVSKMTKADFIENLANKLTAENQLKINKGEEAIKNVDDIATAVANAKGTNDKPILIFSDTSKD